MMLDQRVERRLGRAAAPVDGSAVLGRQPKRGSRSGPAARTSGRSKHPGLWIESSGVNMSSRDCVPMGRRSRVQ